MSRRSARAACSAVLAAASARSRAEVRGTKSVAGLSSSTLELYIVFYVSRLSTTCFHNSYLPADHSGQYIYQAPRSALRGASAASDVT